MYLLFTLEKVLNTFFVALDDKVYECLNIKNDIHIYICCKMCVLLPHQDLFQEVLTVHGNAWSLTHTMK